MSLQRTGFGLLLLLAFTFWVEGAHADPASADPLAKPERAEAREHLAKGNKLYAIREFVAAIAEYKAGAIVEDAPVFQYNLAQAYRLSGQYEEALWHYDRFVKRTQPSGLLKSAIEQFTVQMKAELDKAASKQAPTEASPGDPPSAPVQGGSRPPAVASSSRWYQDRPGWILAGSGTLLVATAALLFVNAHGLERDALQESQESHRSSLQDRAGTRRVAGYVVGSFGIAAIVVGAVKLAIHRDGRGATALTVAGQF